MTSSYCISWPKLIGTDFLLPFLLFHIVREMVLSGPSDSLKHYVSKAVSEYFYPNGLLLSDWALYSVFVKIQSEIVALLVIFLHLSRSPLLEIRRKWNLFQGVLAILIVLVYLVLWYQLSMSTTLQYKNLL